jgi:hypothetical protein
MLTAMHALPSLVKVAVQQAEDGRFAFGVRSEELAALREEIRLSERRRNGTLVGVSLGLGSLLWLGFEMEPRIIGTLLLIASGVMLWRVRRTGRALNRA